MMGYPSVAYEPQPDDIDVSLEHAGAGFACSASAQRSSPATGPLWRRTFAVHLGDTLVLFTAPDGGTMVMTCKFLLGSSWKRV